MGKFLSKLSLGFMSWTAFINTFTYAYTITRDRYNFKPSFFRDLCLLGGSIGGFLGRIENIDNLRDFRIFRIRDLIVTGLSNLGLFTLTFYVFKKGLNQN